MQMAKLFRTTNERHPFCYALQQCEDVIVADAYLDLKAGTTDRHLSIVKVLDQYWLGGQGLSDRTLISINTIRRSEGLSEIVFVDGHSTIYSLARGEGKAQSRRNILAALQQLKRFGPSRHTEILERARGAANALPRRNLLDFAA
jgi:hypothetical protein